MCRNMAAAVTHFGNRAKQPGLIPGLWGHSQNMGVMRFSDGKQVDRMILEVDIKIRILVPDTAGRELQTGGIHRYFENLKRAPNTDRGAKRLFGDTHESTRHNPWFGDMR